ncbi:TniQ family protein [Streptomyces cinereoruber]|uniref:TniQ family protein n=1 Tax=Streptomyces cinereoruber TaxID=67260 RepID=UPI003BF46F70
MPSASDPLPRSLRPLPDESLPGFLLRLTHRLDLTPSQLARRTGLVTAGAAQARPPASRLLMLEAATLHAFAEATRITAAEADELTLHPFIDRYPALKQALVRPGSTARPRTVFPPWLLMTYSRYCPACLAGDGTPTQNRHGGPWKRQWRLGISFACLDHQVLLRTNCPRCRLPALGGRPGSPLTLLPGASTPRLHPAQCRNPSPAKSPGREVCGHRLDDPHPPLPALPPELADLQASLLDLLFTDVPAELAFHRFADLQVAASLVQAGWPTAADLAPSGTRAALDAHLAPQQQTADTRSGPSWNTPPDDAGATAALLFAAYHLLAQDPSAPRSDMPRMLRHLPSRDDLRWGRTWHMLAADGSPKLRRQVDQVFRRELPSDWLRQGAPTLRTSRANSTKKLFTPTRTLKHLGLDPAHIPQTLPTSWLLVATLGDTDSRLPGSRHLRRLLPVHLVQAISSLNFLEAATFLGIPDAWTTQAPRRIKPLIPHRDLKGHDLPATLRRLAHHVVRQQKIDYQARRTRFAAWHLDEETWEELCRQHVPRRGRRPTDRTRESASALVWSRITGSEPSLAPIFHPPMSPPDRHLSSSSPQMALISLWERQTRYTSYPQLFVALEALAVQITRNIAHTP